MILRILNYIDEEKKPFFLTIIYKDIKDTKYEGNCFQIYFEFPKEY